MKDGAKTSILKNCFSIGQGSECASPPVSARKGAFLLSISFSASLPFPFTYQNLTELYFGGTWIIMSNEGTHTHANLSF
eukprot:scaffold2069_cov187-Amphora_coffeaeformis.AAC.42